MTMRLPAKTVMIILITSVSTTSLLSACGYTKRKLDYYTNDREPQVVDGPRRVPLMNPHVAPLAPEQPAKKEESSFLPSFSTEEESAQVVGEDQVPTYEESPYDYYDNKGNRVEPEQAADKKGENQIEQFFTRLFEGESKVEKLRKQQRKPFMGNDSFDSSEVIDEPAMLPPINKTAPAEPSSPSLWRVESTAPENSVYEPQHAKAEPLFPQGEDVQVIASPAVPAEDEDMLSATQMNEKGDGSTWLGRFVSDVGDAFTVSDASASELERDMQQEPEEELFVQEVMPEEGRSVQKEQGDFPQLTSVPPTPESFEAVKENRSEKIKELQEDLLQAHQDRKELYSEPSSQEAMIPVAFDETIPVISEDGEMLLGHVSDENAPTANTVDVIASAQQSGDAALASAEPSKNPEWWEGWNLFSSKKQNQQMVEDDMKPQVVASVDGEVPARTELQDIAPDYSEHGGTFPWHDGDDFPANKPAGMALNKFPVPEKASAMIEPEAPAALVRNDPGLKPVPAMLKNGREIFEPLGEQTAPVLAEPVSSTPQLLIADDESVVPPLELKAEETAPMLLSAEPVQQVQPLLEEVSPAAGSIEPLTAQPANTPAIVVPAPTQARSDADMQEQFEKTQQLLSEEESAEDALPSLQLLRKAKTLPASRYLNR